jgi:FkbM family methyltransferase
MCALGVDQARDMSRRGITTLRNLLRFPEIWICRKETAQWFALTLAYLGLRAIPFPYEVRLRTGETFTLTEFTDLVVFWLVFIRRHYPVKASDRVIVDVGANVGFFTLYAAREAPSARIISIEPFPETFERLTHLAQANLLENRVTRLNCAVTASSGCQFMESASGVPSQYRAVLSPLTNRLNERHKGIAKPGETGIPIQTETLVGLVDGQGISKADLLKMNIHGNEYEALLSTPPSALRRFGRIAVQYHEVPAKLNLGKKQLIEHLQQAGFKLTLDKDTGRGAGIAVFAAVEPQDVGQD